MINPDIKEDITIKHRWHYLRRTIVPWDDSIKLRYGSKPDDSPLLWSRMEQYVTLMAKTFKGIRLDNAHGTPLHVSKHMLNVARKSNPNLWVMAELFTNNAVTDAHYVTQLGINALIREANAASTPRELGSLIYSYGMGETHTIGRIDRKS